MRVPVGNGWYLCDWNDLPDHEYVEFRGSGTHALQWANQFRTDFFAQSTLRGLLGFTHPSRSDDQIAREVAWRLTSGVWLARRPVARWVTAGRQQEEAAAFPMEERRSTSQSAPGPGQEGPLFPGDIDPLAIAEAQRQAAASGVPFCEECLRAQLANQMANR